MKVYIQIVDTRTGIYQCGMIEEPVKRGFEIQNALIHFGIDNSSVNLVKHPNTDTYSGLVEGTTKVVSVICV